MKNNILLILSFSILFSFSNCQNEKYNIPKLNKEKFSVFEENQELIDNIVGFIENEPFPDVISLKYYENKDTTYFEISPIINLFSIKNYSSVYYFELNESEIIIFSEMSGMQQYSGENLDSLMSKCFPNDYIYYKGKGYCPVVTNYECDVWILKFKNGKLVEREKRPYPETENNRWTVEKFN